MRKIGNITISTAFDNISISSSLINYVDTVCHSYALAGIVNFKFRNEPYYEAEIDWMLNDKEMGICYVVQLWYGCDNFSIHETVQITRLKSGYITITDSEDHNTIAHEDKVKFIGEKQ